MTTINDMIRDGKIYLESFDESKKRFENLSEVIKENEKDGNKREISDVKLRDSMLGKDKGKKYNEGKLMLAQFYKHFPNAYKAMVDNAMYGFKKYDEDINDPNWKKNTIEEYEDALFRHFDSYLTGEIIDKESGKKHLAAVIWNACVLYELNEIKEKGE
jgi:hypothetical protein